MSHSVFNSYMYITCSNITRKILCTLHMSWEKGQIKVSLANWDEVLDEDFLEREL